MSLLFSSYQLGNITLKNRVVMAPMTRSRAIGNLPNASIAKYYADRAPAGLLITEGTSPAPNGLGYARIPGLYSDAQIEAWRTVTDAVHANGGKIFVQLMHCGRVGHPHNLPEGAEIIAPSAIANSGDMYTDEAGMQPTPVPRALRTDEISATIQEFVHSVKAAIAAGFDGVELHGANGYLLDQFLNRASNQRNDQYGGSPENRNRFVLEVAAAVADAIGPERTGIRLAPAGGFGDMATDEHTEAQFAALAEGLGKIGLVYLHLVDHSAMGAPPLSTSVRESIRMAFGSTLILSGGYDEARAEADLAAGKGELVAFGRPFISNPDLVERMAAGIELTQPDPATFYTPGDKGFNDYPAVTKAELQSA